MQGIPIVLQTTGATFEAGNTPMATASKHRWVMIGHAGNLLGGACAAALMSRGIPVVRARKLSVMFFAALLTAGDSGGAGVERVCLDCADFLRNARIHGSAFEHAGDAGRQVSQEHCGFRLGCCEHGRRFRSNGVQPGDGLGCGPLLVRAGIRWIRDSAADFGGDHLVLARRQRGPGRKCELLGLSGSGSVGLGARGEGRSWQKSGLCSGGQLSCEFCY
jgi:hypothetical protein